jgi:transposase
MPLSPCLTNRTGCVPLGVEASGKRVASWLDAGELTEEGWRPVAGASHCIPWKLRTGAPWRDLPERYGLWQTGAERLYRWRRDGTWDRILAHVQTKSDAVGASAGR